MLRSSTDEPRRGLSARATRIITYGLLIASGFVLAGLRSPRTGPEAMADAQAKAKADPRAPDAAEALDATLAYVPDDAALVVAVRPSAFLQRSELRALLDAFRQEEEIARIVGLLDPDSIEQVTAVLSRSAVSLMVANGDTESLLLAGGLIVRTKTPRDWKSAISAILPAPVVESRHAGLVYHSIDLGELVSVGFFQPDPRTLVVASVPVLFGFMQPTRPGATHRWADAWREVAGGEVALVADVGTLAGPFLPMLASADADEEALLVGTVAPLWEETESLALGLRFDDGFGLTLLASCGDEAGAKRVERTVQAVLTLGENAGSRFFPLIRRQALSGDAEAVTLLTLVDLGEQLLDGAEAVRDGSTVRMALDSRIDLGALVRLALMAL